MRQRRPMGARERAEQERWRAEALAYEREVSGQTAAAWKTYRMLKGVLDHSEESLKDLRDVGIANLFMELPAPTIWNDADKELFLAARALDQRSPGRARVRAAVEHVVAAPTCRPGLLIRWVGPAGATARLGLASPVTNMRRLVRDHQPGVRLSRGR